MAKGLRLLLILLPATALPAEVYVPEELAGWEEWVLSGHEYRDCAFFFDRGASGRADFVCVWPGALELDVTASGGRFTQDVVVSVPDAWIGLPGDASHWPDRVTLNGSPAAVIDRNGTPSIAAGPGEYAVAGRFAWEERPARLTVPASSGLVDLTVDGRRVARPALDGGSLFLGDREPEATERDTLAVETYRLVTDAVPTRLTTRLSVDVSGGVREAVLGPVLPSGFVPVSLSSPLPARFEADGRLRLQVRPGRWQVTLVARAPATLDAVTLEAATLADTEIWSFRSDDRLRVTAAEGLPPVDPGRVGVPAEWQQLPAFRVTEGDTLEIRERSRGRASAENALTLSRDLWLDFDGGGFTLRDAIGGRMQTDWRLDMREPFVLASASEAGANLLVTRGDEAGETGIELRRPDVDVAALARIESRDDMPVTGWTTRFTDVGANLYLPPGHKLFAAPGADRAVGSWAGNWQLLDFFLVLIITIAVFRLLGPAAGAIALFALTLSYNEPGAPAWLWLNLLVALALARVAPAGRLRTTVRSYLAVSFVFLALALVPFAGNQLKYALYPQLEPQYPAYQTAPGRLDMPRLPAADNVQFEDDAALRKDEERSVVREQAGALEEIVVTGNRLDSMALSRAPSAYKRYADNAIVQTGPGIPSWQWNRYRLQWSGPVDADQSLDLLILPRWFVSLLRVVSVGLLIAFAGVLLASATGRAWRLPGGFRTGSGAAVLLLVASLGGLALPVDDARADTPPPQLLQELEARLTRAPDCVPRCAELTAASVEVAGDGIRITLIIDALEDVALPLPASARGWRPDAVSTNGSSPATVIRDRDGLLWLRVPAGRQRVVVAGTAAGADSLEIPFPAPPRIVDVNADGWVVTGVKDRRLLSGSIELSRVRDADTADGAARWESSRFPPFVVVTRALEIDLDWRIHTTVTRIAPTEGALSLDIPLVDGETVISEDIEVVDGRVRVAMGPSQSSFRWISNLEKRSPVELTAFEDVPWTETWYVGVGSIWHVEFDGVPESGGGEGLADVRMAEFHPRGGESLTIVATRPEAAAGATLAFDSVTLDTDRGSRTATSTLVLEYRSTRGDEHVVRLPGAAEVTRVLLDGTQRALKADEGVLSVPILPGSHSITIEWREDVDIGAVIRTPAVDLGAPAGNVTMKTTLPRDRWLLGTRGPVLGPAVLYWSELAVLVLFALLLGRITWVPLGGRHWLLLGLGFSTFNWPVMALVVGWLLAVGARERWRGETTWWRYNLLQMGIVIATVVALVAIVVSLPQGLLGSPDMHVTGNDSWGNRLSWFADRSASALPTATAVSAPIWTYKVLILAWALWLSLALLRWLPWTWKIFARDGFFAPQPRPRDPTGGAAR